MAEGRSRATWNHTSSVLALVANVNRDPKRTRPFTPKQFNPHETPRRPRGRKRHRRPITVAQLTDEIMALATNGKK